MSATEKLQQSSGPFLASLRNAASENPAAAALIGAGVLWLFASRIQIWPAAKAGAGGVAEAVSDTRRASAEAVQSAWRSAKENAADVAGRAADQVQQAGNRFRDAAAPAAASLRERGEVGSQERGAAIGQQVSDRLNAGAETFTSTRAQLGEVFERQPLTLAVVGLAIGAAVAASLPMTAAEDKVLGATSDALRDQATRFAAEQKDRAAEAVSSAVDRAAAEARAQNLTTDALKSGVEDAAAKLGGVAEVAAETLREKMRPSQ